MVKINVIVSAAQRGPAVRGLAPLTSRTRPPHSTATVTPFPGKSLKKNFDDPFPSPFSKVLTGLFPYSLVRISLKDIKIYLSDGIAAFPVVGGGIL